MNVSDEPFEIATHRVTPHTLQDDEGRVWVLVGSWGLSDVGVFAIGAVIGSAAAWSYAAVVLCR